MMPITRYPKEVRGEVLRLLMEAAMTRRRAYDASLRRRDSDGLREYYRRLSLEAENRVDAAMRQIAK